MTTEPGTYEATPWDAEGVAWVTASGEDAQTAVAAGLRAVVAATDQAPTGDGGELSASFRGQGADLAAVFAELAADLLAQLDANGPGLHDIRLDGLLATDDGGWTAWGYLSGSVIAQPPPIGLALDGPPTVEETAGRVTIRFPLRRS